MKLLHKNAIPLVEINYEKKPFSNEKTGNNKWISFCYLQKEKKNLYALHDDLNVWCMHFSFYINKNLIFFAKQDQFTFLIFLNSFISHNYYDSKSRMFIVNIYIVCFEL